VLRAQQPFVAQKMLGEIDANKALTEERRFQLRRGEKLLPLEEKGKLTDIKKDEAAIKASDWQVQRGQELLQFEKNRITADINQSNKAAGLSEAGEWRIRQTVPKELEELDKKIKQYVDMEYKGQNFTVPGSTLLNEINDHKKIIAAEYEKQQQRIREARSDDAKALKTSTEAETAIKTGKLDGYSRKPSELLPQLDLYHSTSKNPKVYIYEKVGGTFGSSEKLVQRDLPKIDGHQYTAREIYDKADKRGMTTQEYLEKVFYPMYQQAVPWVSAFPAQ
jgi:hypothetical protein